MESYLTSDLFDLVSPDGKIQEIQESNPKQILTTVIFENISCVFKGFFVPNECISFNLKSTLAQLGLDAKILSCTLHPAKRTAEAQVLFIAYGAIAESLLSYLQIGAYVGKLFAADERRIVRDPEYLLRMFRRSDRHGKPLLYLGDCDNSDELLLEKQDNQTIAHLSLLAGTVTNEPIAAGFIPLLGKALREPSFKMRSLLKLIQKWNPGESRTAKEGQILLVKTKPLHIRTAFARVKHSLLPKNLFHTSADILEPHTKESGDIYELFGKDHAEIRTIPLEFFTLEPHREHVFFSDRDQLQSCLENEKILFDTFQAAPHPLHHEAAIFIVKSNQLLELRSSDWITRDPHFYEFPGKIYQSEKQALLMEKYIEQQAIYPFLKAIEDEVITSQGVLFTRFFPSPLLKKMLLDGSVTRCLKGIYFQNPSHAYGDFFSHEDRSTLHDLAQFAIPVYWIDKTTGKVLQYIPKPNKDTGMFVPLAQIKDFLKATSFGIYGSNLLSSALEQELYKLFRGIETLRMESSHPLLNQDTPLALITGGGPGVMEMGNKLAKSLNILSCANIVDFRHKNTSFVNEQRQNPYIDIKMTYRLDKLVERQAEFYLDFPIFLAGGIGTDFEFSLEELRRKVGSSPLTPVLLFGPHEYWHKKITSRFQCNLESGTIAGSEWISNSFFCVQTAEEGLKIYQKFFSGNLLLGKNGPTFPEGFTCLHKTFDTQ